MTELGLLDEAWCETHEFQIKPGANVCLASLFSHKACRRIVSKLLSVYPKEAENE